MTDLPAVARHTDPASSHAAADVARFDGTLNEQILHAAKRLHPVPFDDWDLLTLIEEQTGRRQQRNVIARQRGLVEQTGALVRLGLRKRTGRETLHFTLPTGEQGQLDL